MHQYLISLLIFLPLVAALVALFVPARSVNIFRWITLIASLIQIAALSQVMIAYDPAADLQFVEQKPWITLDLGSWGVLKAEYFVAIDGLNILFVCLTIGVMLITGC